MHPLRYKMRAIVGGDVVMLYALHVDERWIDDTRRMAEVGRNHDRRVE